MENKTINSFINRYKYLKHLDSILNLLEKRRPILLKGDCLKRTSNAHRIIKKLNSLLMIVINPSLIKYYQILKS